MLVILMTILFGSPVSPPTELNFPKVSLLHLSLKFSLYNFQKKCPAFPTRNEKEVRRRNVKKKT